MDFWPRLGYAELKIASGKALSHGKSKEKSKRRLALDKIDINFID
jgi:hypothetical protein